MQYQNWLGVKIPNLTPTPRSRSRVSEWLRSSLTLTKNISVFLWFCSLFRVLWSIVYAISCVFLCLPVSSFFCVENDLLCSSERCFVYYLKIQATESFEISQNSVHMNIVTNILPLSITIFMFSLLQSFDHFRPELHANFRVFFRKKYCCPLRSIGQLSFRTPCLF
jgi:hypothetical protein